MKCFGVFEYYDVPFQTVTHWRIKQIYKVRKYVCIYCEYNEVQILKMKPRAGSSNYINIEKYRKIGRTLQRARMCKD